MTEADTLRTAITVALAYLDSGHVTEARAVLREARATPREPPATGLDYRGG